MSAIARTSADPMSAIEQPERGPEYLGGSGLARRAFDGRGGDPLRRHGEHFAEYVAFGVFFSVVAWLQAIWAVGVTVLPSKRLLLVGLVGNALVILVWLTSRTTGLPIGPESGAPEPAAFVDVLSTILEVAIVVGTATLLLRGRPTPSVRGLPVWLGLAGLVVVLAMLTTWSVAAGANPEGEHGMDHGVDDGAAIAQGSGFARVNLGNGGWSVQVLVDASDAFD